MQGNTTGQRGGNDLTTPGASVCWKDAKPQPASDAPGDGSMPQSELWRK